MCKKKTPHIIFFSIIGMLMIFFACGMDDDTAEPTLPMGDITTGTGTQTQTGTSTGYSPTSGTAAGTMAGTSTGTSTGTATGTSTGTATGTATGGEPYKYFYFSYDDSASTAAVELTKYSLENNLNPYKTWARPWEFLNYENFVHNGQTNIGKFDVSMGVWKHDTYGSSSVDTYTLGCHVTGPTLNISGRQNVVLTIVVDVSGSMAGNPSPLTSYNPNLTKLMLAKNGLNLLIQQLKAGDVINLVAFETTTHIHLDGFVYDGTNSQQLLNAIANLQTIGSTDLNQGLSTGYQLANYYFDASKTNRVIMLTDAYANTGVIDTTIISSNVEINNQEGIYFSGLGYGYDFNEGFLNELTEAGRGAYFAVVTEADSEKAFSTNLISLLQVAARDVRFKLEYPGLMTHITSAAEEVSTDPQDVQPTNFSYNTSQYFLEGFAADKTADLTGDYFKLTIFYKDPVTYQETTETYQATITDIIGNDLDNIKDAFTITLLTSLMSGNIDDAQASHHLTNELEGYSSTLYDEYNNLIMKWMNLNP